MKLFWRNAFFRIFLSTVAGLLLGFLLDSISLFTGIGFALGLGYFFIAKNDE